MKKFVLCAGIFLVSLLPLACQKKYSMGPQSAAPPVIPTSTMTNTLVPTSTPTPTITKTGTNTITLTATRTATRTPTNSSTRTPTNSPTATYTRTITLTPIPVNVTTFAGSAGVTGAMNGTGTAATFNWPVGITIDSGGSLYVSDTFNNMIRGISPGGVVWTVAGTAGVTGSTNATGTAASFNLPNGLVADNLGNLYVADAGNNKIRKIDVGGVVTTLAGSGAIGSANGTGTLASFYYPFGVAYEASTGNIYVADNANAKVRKIVPVAVVSTLAGSGAIGSANGPGATASFDFPWAIAVDTSGNVYVSDFWNNLIRKIDGTGTVSTFAGSGTAGSLDGIGTAASFNGPMGLAFDAAGNLFVADSFNDKIRRITPAGQVTTYAGTGAQGSANGPGTSATFYDPTGVAVDSSGAVYVTDRGNSLIRKIQ